MKNSIKSKKAISIILTLIMLLFTTNVYAANDSFKTALSVNNSSVKRGENVTITISLNDISIESGEKGIGAYTASLEFNSSVFEYVKTEGTDKWEAPVYQEKRIVGNTVDGEVVNTNQSIGTITFKVKEDATLGETTVKLTNFSGSNAETDISSEDATLGETTVKLTNFSGSNAETDISSEDATVKITIVDNENGGGSSQGGSEGGTQSGSQNETGNKPTPKPGNNNSSKEDIKDGSLPATGYSYTVIYILISVFVLTAIIFGVKIKLLNKKSKNE